MMIYLDNAATTLHKPPQVIEAVVNAMTYMGNSARGAHQATLSAGRTIYDTREKLCRLFHGSSPEHIIFTSNSTEALNVAIQGAVTAGSHVLTTDLEHNSVLRPLYRLEREEKISLYFAKTEKNGSVNYEDLERQAEVLGRKMEEKQIPQGFIICTHGSNLTGNLVDIERVGEIAHRNHLHFFVDASQTAGVFPIDMEKMHIDILCFTGHKGLYGPQGTGGMCVASDLRIRPLKVGGSGIRTYDKEHPSALPTALEAGTLNGHGIAGLGAGVDFIMEIGMDQIRKREQKLARCFYEGVKDLPQVKLYGDYENGERAPIVALNIGDYDSGEVSDELAQRFEIATRSGGHCAPRMHDVLGTAEQGAVRFSFSYFNTEEEVEQARKAVRTLSEE